MAKLSLILLAVVAGIAVAKAAENDPQAFLNIFNARHKEPGPQAKARVNVVTSYIEQKLDHFDDKETRTWQMVRAEGRKGAVKIKPHYKSD